MTSGQPSRYSGGVSVKANTLQPGDFIRDPKKRDRVMVVLGIGSKIQARGLEKGQTKYHRFINKEDFVEKVTNATTENSVNRDATEGTV